MKNFVRVLALILLLSTTIIFVIKLWKNIPISYMHLFVIFFIGAISLFWANIREKKSDK